MWPDRVLNPGPLTYESVALPTALRGPALPGRTQIRYKMFPWRPKRNLSSKRHLIVISDHRHFSIFHNFHTFSNILSELIIS